MKMHVIQRLSLGAIMIFALGLRAQSPPNPDNTSEQANQTLNANAAAVSSPSPTAAVEPPLLIPPNNLPGPDSSSLPQTPGSPDLQLLNALFKQTSLGKTADEHRLRVQMAELETRIRNDDELRTLRVAAHQVPTDLERRQRLKAYYQLYFKKLRGLASTPDLKTYLGVQEAAHELPLLQPKVRHELDEAEAAKLTTAMAGASATPALVKPVQARVNNVFHP